MSRKFSEKGNCTRCSVSRNNYEQRRPRLPMRNQGKPFENLVIVSSLPSAHAFLQRKRCNLPRNKTDDNELMPLNYFIDSYNKYNPKKRRLEDLISNMKTLSIIMTMLKNYFYRADKKYRDYLASLNKESAIEIQDVETDLFEELSLIYNFVSDRRCDLLERQNDLRYANEWIPAYRECKRNLPANPKMDKLIADLNKYNDIFNESYLIYDPDYQSNGIFGIVQNALFLKSAFDCELSQISQSPHISGKTRSLSISSAQEYFEIVNGLEDNGMNPDLVNETPQEESKNIDIGDRISEFFQGKINQIPQGGINLFPDHGRINLHFPKYKNPDEYIEHYSDNSMIPEGKMEKAESSIEISKTHADLKGPQFHAIEVKPIPMELIISAHEEDEKDNEMNRIPHEIVGLEHGDFGGASDLFTVDFINHADRIKSFSNFESQKETLMYLNKYPLVAVALKKYLSSCRSSPDDFNLNIKYLAEVFEALESEPKIMEIIEQSRFYELCVSDMQFWTVRKAEARKSSTSPVNILIVHPQEPRVPIPRSIAKICNLKASAPKSITLPYGPCPVCMCEVPNKMSMRRGRASHTTKGRQGFSTLKFRSPDNKQKYPRFNLSRVANEWLRRQIYKFPEFVRAVEQYQSMDLRQFDEFKKFKELFVMYQMLFCKSCDSCLVDNAFDIAIKNECRRLNLS